MKQRRFAQPQRLMHDQEPPDPDQEAELAAHMTKNPPLIFLLMQTETAESCITAIMRHMRTAAEDYEEAMSRDPFFANYFAERKPSRRDFVGSYVNYAFEKIRSGAEELDWLKQVRLHKQSKGRSADRSIAAVLWERLHLVWASGRFWKKLDSLSRERANAAAFKPAMVCVLPAPLRLTHFISEEYDLDLPGFPLSLWFELRVRPNERTLLFALLGAIATVEGETLFSSSVFPFLSSLEEEDSSYRRVGLLVGQYLDRPEVDNFVSLARWKLSTLQMRELKRATTSLSADLDWMLKHPGKERARKAPVLYRTTTPEIAAKVERTVEEIRQWPTATEYALCLKIYHSVDGSYRKIVKEAMVVAEFRERIRVQRRQRRGKGK